MLGESPSVKIRNEVLLHIHVCRVRRNIPVIFQKEIQNEMSSDFSTLTRNNDTGQWGTESARV